MGTIPAVRPHHPRLLRQIVVLEFAAGGLLQRSDRERDCAALAGRPRTFAVADLPSCWPTCRQEIEAAPRPRTLPHGPLEDVVRRHPQGARRPAAQNDPFARPRNPGCGPQARPAPRRNGKASAAPAVKAEPRPGRYRGQTGEESRLWQSSARAGTSSQPRPSPRPKPTARPQSAARNRGPPKNRSRCVRSLGFPEVICMFEPRPAYKDGCGRWRSAPPPPRS